MKKTIHHKRTLFYYDGPQLFLAHDQSCTQYLCLLVENAEEFDRFLCVPVSEVRLREFYEGRIDLRKIYAEPERKELYYTDIIDSFEGEIHLFPMQYEDLREEWLPEAGFDWDSSEMKDDAMIQEAIIDSEK